jgi:uncharacterized membrane protein (DUF106 family)
MAFEFLADIYNAIVVWLSNALGPFNDPPLAMVTIFLITIGMAAISSGATRLLTDVDEMKRRMVEVREWQSEYTKAIRAKDEKAIAKAKKKELTIKRAQAEMSKEQMKPMLFTIIPFFVFYYLFYAVFGYNLVTVGYSPIELPYIGTTFNFWTWYLIASFSVSALIQRLFRVPSAGD